MINASLERIMISNLMIFCLLFGSYTGNRRENATCGTKTAGDEFLLCHCDALCEIYQDCCYGYLHNASDSPENFRSEIYDLSTCEHVEGQPYNVYMVSIATSKQPRMRTFVQRCHQPNMSISLEALPVYNTWSRSTFKNIFCGVQLKVQVYEDIIGEAGFFIWSIQTTIDCFKNIMENLNPRRYTDLLSHILTKAECPVTLIAPEISEPRICFRHDVDGCDKEIECKSYQSPVVNQAGVFFKNKHCAECLGLGSDSTDPILHNPIDDKQTKTMITMHRLSSNRGPWESDCERDGDCRQNCSENEMAYFDRCIQPIDTVKGLLHRMEFQINSSKAFERAIEGERFRSVLERFFKDMDTLFISFSVRTTQGRFAALICLYTIKISLYLREEVNYTVYLGLSDYVREILRDNYDDIETGIMDIALRNNENCVVEAHDAEGFVHTTPSIFDDTRLIIFGSIFSVFVLAILSAAIYKFARHILYRYIAEYIE